MAADDGLGRGLPGEADARRDVLLDVKRRVIVPAETKVQSQIVTKPPIILAKDRVVVVPQMNLVGRGRETAGGGDREKAGVDRPIGDKVINRGEELKVQNL